MIVRITRAKVGHRQAPNKQQSPPREGFVVCNEGKSPFDFK